MKSLDADQDFNNPLEHLEVEQKGGGGAGAKAERRCLFLLRPKVAWTHLTRGYGSQSNTNILWRAWAVQESPPPISNQTRRFPECISKKN